MRGLRLLRSWSPVQAPNGLHGFLNKPDEECGEEGAQPFEESVIHAMNSKAVENGALGNDRSGGAPPRRQRRACYRVQASVLLPSRVWHHNETRR